MFDNSEFGAAGKAPADRADDFAEETDAEAAAICLTCRRSRCLLDDSLPCRRYRRELRKLKARRRLADGTDSTGITDIADRGEG